MVLVLAQLMVLLLARLMVLVLVLARLKVLVLAPDFCRCAKQYHRAGCLCRRLRP